VSSVSSGIDVIDGHVVLREPSVVTVSFPVRYGESFTTALVPQLQLWHLHWLVFPQSMGDLHSRLPYALHFLSSGDAAPIVETHKCLDDVNQDNV
jgi:hypothetical protein